MTAPPPLGSAFQRASVSIPCAAGPVTFVTLEPIALQAPPTSSGPLSEFASPIVGEGQAALQAPSRAPTGSNATTAAVTSTTGVMLLRFLWTRMLMSPLADGTLLDVVLSSRRDTTGGAPERAAMPALAAAANGTADRSAGGLTASVSAFTFRVSNERVDSVGPGARTS